MEIILAIVTGTLYGTGIYMLLRRSIIKLVIGLVLISQAANLLIFTAAGVTRGSPPIIADEATTLVAPYADPLPQALILTAIVIGFGVLAFALILLKQAYTVIGNDDIDTLKTSDT